MEIIIERLRDTGINTLGRLFLMDDEGEVLFRCKTLELSWLKNKRNYSCIPIGKYTSRIIERPNDKGEAIWLENVMGRKGILIHSGNYASSSDRYPTHVTGCILVGRTFADLNADGVKDIAKSKETLIDLLALIPEDIEGLPVDIYYVESALNMYSSLKGIQKMPARVLESQY